MSTERDVLNKQTRQSQRVFVHHGSYSQAKTERVGALAWYSATKREGRTGARVLPATTRALFLVFGLADASRGRSRATWELSRQIPRAGRRFWQAGTKCNARRPLPPTKGTRTV